MEVLAVETAVLEGDWEFRPHVANVGNGIEVFAGFGEAGAKFGFVKVDGNVVAEITGPDYWNKLLVVAAEFLPLPDEAATIYDEVQLTLAA